MKLIRNIFNKKHPKQRYLYAVQGGVYLGEMFVLMENKKEEKAFLFLSLPDFHIRTVSYEKFEFGLSNKILDVVEELPENVYQTCVAQYNKIVSEAYVLNKSIDCKRKIANK